MDGQVNGSASQSGSLNSGLPSGLVGVRVGEGLWWQVHRFMDY